MPEVKKKSAFNKAMTNTNEWLMGYAKFMCNFSNKSNHNILKGWKIYESLLIE